MPVTSHRARKVAIIQLLDSTGTLFYRELFSQTILRCGVHRSARYQGGGWKGIVVATLGGRVQGAEKLIF